MDVSISTEVSHLSNRPKLFIGWPVLRWRRERSSVTQVQEALKFESEIFVNSEVSSQRTIFANTLSASEIIAVTGSSDEQNESDTPEASEASDDVDHIRILPRSSHRFGAQAASATASICLVFNLTAAIWLGTHSNPDSGLVNVFQGSCKQVSAMTVGVHFVINGLSTVLLAGSNYCMQCLCGPTRQDIDRRHRNGKYLDIGTPSIRNLSAIASHKTCLWVLLLLSSLPIHLLYNSAFYSSIAVQNYNIYVVTDQFTNGPPLTKDNVTTYCKNNRACRDSTDTIFSEISGIQATFRSNKTWEELDPLDCIRAYAQPMLTNRRQLIIVTNSTDTNNTLRNIDYYDHSTTILGSSYYDWICEASFGAAYAKDYGVAKCQRWKQQLEEIPSRWTPFHYKADRCFSELVPEQCSFSGNIIVLIVVVTCNAVKAIIMLFVAYRLQGKPILNLGDAIQSFLNDPDPTTRGLCWLSKEEVLKQQRTFNVPANSVSGRLWPLTDAGAQEFANHRRGGLGNNVRLKSHRWAKAASLSRWIITLGLIFLTLLVTTSLFLYAYLLFRGRGTGTNAFSLGFGRLSPLGLISNWGPDAIRGNSGQVLAFITLIANSPQLLFSFIYFYINGLVTVMYSAKEWSGYAKTARYLRVSSPRGRQTSTYYLTLPYHVGIPLMVMCGLFHWLISQSIFPAIIAEYNPSGTLQKSFLVATCGYSPLAILVTIVLGVILATAIISMGSFGKLDPRSRLVSNCSAAISACCHGPSWDKDAELKRLRFGALPISLAERKDVQGKFEYNWAAPSTSLTRKKEMVTMQTIEMESAHQDMQAYGHLCLTSGEVEDPREDVLYS